MRLDGGLVAYPLPARAPAPGRLRMTDEPIDVRPIDSLEMSIRSFTVEASIIGEIAQDALHALVDSASEAREAGEIDLALRILARADTLIDRFRAVIPPS